MVIVFINALVVNMNMPKGHKMAKIKKPRELTIKQKKFFKELPNAPSMAEAARRAGYSPTSARVQAHQNITKHNDLFISILEEHGLTDEKIAQTICDGINASTLFFFGGKLMGRLNQSAIEKLAKQGIEVSGDDFLEIPDPYARHKYLDTLCKLKGHYIGKEDAPGLTMNFINLWKKSKEEGEDKT